jgi:outer membrane protein OmpA-like peptidoglycan-associated protein
MIHAIFFLNLMDHLNSLTMKYPGKFLVLVMCLLISTHARSQIDLLKKARQKTEKRTEKEADKKIDEGLDKLFGTKKDAEPGQSGSEATVQPAVNTSPGEATGSNVPGSAAGDVEPPDPTGVLKWAKYDFVPGDKIIFEDDLMFEENGEFPSRWDLANGVAEVAQLDGENVIMFRGGSPTIIPYLENSSQDYLPEVFTLEFDYYPGGTSGWITLYLWDRKNQSSPRGSQNSLDVHPGKMTISGSESSYPGKKLERNRWIHVAVAYTSGKFKAYMDDTRLINIPRLDLNPTGISLHSYHASDNNPIYVKNIRIAEGGVKYYDRVMQDGKIIANGIRFDVGKATLRPESMGIINEVVELMGDHPELNFSVEGHTDSDGNDELNLELSQRRAETVMNEMIRLGISADRLQAKGLGESQPITGNASPEDKANNRRVEFVKL